MYIKSNLKATSQQNSQAKPKLHLLNSFLYDFDFSDSILFFWFAWIYMNSQEFA
jgi:hypothetical protein